MYNSELSIKNSDIFTKLNVSKYTKNTVVIHTEDTAINVSVFVELNKNDVKDLISFLKNKLKI